MSTKAGAFDEMVLDAVGSLEQRLGQELTQLEVAVEEVPPSDPAPWERRIALGRVFPAQGDLPARVVIYRRPVETRAGSASEVAGLVYEVLAEQVASLLGRDPEDLL